MWKSDFAAGHSWQSLACNGSLVEQYDVEIDGIVTDQVCYIKIIIGKLRRQMLR